MNELSHVPELDESQRNVCWVTKEMSHRMIHQDQGENVLVVITMGSFFFGISTRLLIFFSCLVLWTYSPNVFFLVIIVIIEECKLWTIKWFPSTVTMPFSQPLCISSRHYTSLDQWCHPVGRVASNVIMCYLDIMRCKQVSGLMLWFQCIVSLLPSLKCLLPNEMVDLDDIEGGREGWLGCT